MFIYYLNITLNYIGNPIINKNKKYFINNKNKFIYFVKIELIL